MTTHTDTTPRTFMLGGDTPVNRLGFGAMRLTGQPGNFGPYADWAQGIGLLQRAADLGVTFFDSAWAYGPQTADQIVGSLAPYGDLQRSSTPVFDRAGSVFDQPQFVCSRRAHDQRLGGLPSDTHFE